MKSELNEFLYRRGLAEQGSSPRWVALRGGVSSDIWRVDLPGGPICVKRALARLRVASDWRAPVERNEYEWEWFNFVFERFPALVPRPLAHDPELKMLAMQFLDPQGFRLWKSDLLGGAADVAFAKRVGTALAEIHAASAAESSVRSVFATDDLFFALRIEPYLLATAKQHPDLANHIEEIAERTLHTKNALVHGDVSPKNILIGPSGPVFLDAETAWFGDPAFDLAFCLNHLLLKSVHRPRSVNDYLACFRALSNEYLRRVDWEPAGELSSRAADLLPILFLARVDGKSPVEYIEKQDDKETVRRLAKTMIHQRSDGVMSIPEYFER